jgi:predicted nucleic acid-binding Zn ribbon protein
MQLMRDLLRSSLAKSLASLSPLDRLASAWPVAAGHGIAERSSVTDFKEGIATVTVADAVWQAQLRSTADQLKRELARISGVPLTDILFLLPVAASRTRPAEKPQGNPRAKAPFRARTGKTS